MFTLESGSTKYTDGLNFSTYVGSAVMGMQSSVVETVLGESSFCVLHEKTVASCGLCWWRSFCVPESAIDGQ